MKNIKIANDIDNSIKEILKDSINIVIATDGVSKLVDIMYKNAGMGVVTDIIQEINEGSGLLQ